MVGECCSQRGDGSVLGVSLGRSAVPAFADLPLRVNTTQSASLHGATDTTVPPLTQGSSRYRIRQRSSGVRFSVLRQAATCRSRFVSFMRVAARE